MRCPLERRVAERTAELLNAITTLVEAAEERENAEQFLRKTEERSQLLTPATNDIWFTATMKNRCG